MIGVVIVLCNCTQTKKPSIQVTIESNHQETYTGRLLIAFGRFGDREPRMQIGHWANSSPMFGMDISEVNNGGAITFDPFALGYPYEQFQDVPPGKYYVQAILNVYTKFDRSDGQSVWLPNDQWEGQIFKVSPGNLVSEVDTIEVKEGEPIKLNLTLSRVLPLVSHMIESEYVKKVKIKSELLSEFWGQDMFVGAYLALPNTYHDNSVRKYPVAYHTGYFEEYQSHYFDESSDFFQKWMEPVFPQMLIVHLMHPNPYNSHCFAANSENCGPIQDAIMKELIPHLEEHFRIEKSSGKRILFGGSSGGLIATRLQVFYPDFFGGLWAFAPDVVDFSHFQLNNIYEDTNFYSTRYTWNTIDKPTYRNEFGQPYLTVKQYNQFERVLGSKGRSSSEFDSFSAAFCPVDEDGYPRPFYDKRTGRIDSVTAEYMRRHDVLQYLKDNWSEVGPSLVGKLHFVTPDMDSYYLNEPTYELEAFLESTKNPYYGGEFLWGRPRKEHGWTPWDDDMSEFFRVLDQAFSEKRMGE